jgi:hypothetical protein
MAANIWSEHVKEAVCQGRQIAGATTLTMADHGAVLWATAAAAITDNDNLQDGFFCIFWALGATITVGDASVATTACSLFLRTNSTSRLVPIGTSVTPSFA